LQQIHNDLGHKAYFICKKRLTDRFWWPMMDQDLRWYLNTCHECQLCATDKILLPPTVAMPMPLFHKVYADTLFMPRHNRYRTEILCRWGAVVEISMDNGAPWVKAVEWLSKQFNIHHIRISGYNSRTQGVIECRHHPVHEALIKACESNMTLWTQKIFYVFWAERVSISKAMGRSPYYMAHGVEPLFPFDIAEATYMSPILDKEISTAEMIAARALRLMKREDELQLMRSQVYEDRIKSIRQWEKDNTNNIVDFDFEPRRLVIVWNASVENNLTKKNKPRYFGPMIVVRRKLGGPYILAELDGAIGKQPYAAFRLIPYFPRSAVIIPVTKIIERQIQTVERAKDMPTWGDDGLRDWEGQAAPAKKPAERKL
ncbi:hypothetical protein B0H10DRAFT_1828866, partial [Mycena sp. CBHHK59/15]